MPADPATSHVPDRVYLVMVSSLQLSPSEWMARFLASLESVPELMPSHWGPDERARIRYVRDEVLASVGGQPVDAQLPALRRATPPAYLAYSMTGFAWRAFRLELEAGPRQEDVLPLYQFADALAERVAPEFGFVHPAWRGCAPEYNASGFFKLTEFETYGPRAAAFARTWLGPYLIDLLGEERLAGLPKLGMTLEHTPWGGLRLDLADPPWSADCPTLSTRQAQAMTVLGPSRIFGDYSGQGARIKGPAWVRPTRAPAAAPAPAQPAQAEPEPVRQLKRALLAEEEVTNADVSGLDLRRIDLTSLRAANLRAERTDLSDALLSGAKLMEANFEGARLDNAHLAGANIGMTVMNDASLRGACLERTLFMVAYCHRTDFSDADLTRADIRGTLFFDSRFDRAVLREVKANDACFDGASLLQADLRQGEFVKASFAKADLTGADLRDGDFREADFRGATLEQINWDNANVEGATFDAPNGQTR